MCHGGLPLRECLEAVWDAQSEIEIAALLQKSLMIVLLDYYKFFDTLIRVGIPAEITNLIGSKQVVSMCTSMVKGSNWCRGGRAIVEKLSMGLGLTTSGSHAMQQSSSSQAYLNKRMALRLWNPLQSHALS